MTHPDPQTVVAAARDRDPVDATAAPNVAVTGSVDADAVERTDNGYHALTVGVADKAHDVGAVEQRQ